VTNVFNACRGTKAQAEREVAISAVLKQRIYM